VTWWLGREDSNLRMAESKSDRFHCKINVHSDKLREFAPKCINSLAPISEWSAFPASHRMGRRACIAGANSHRVTTAAGSPVGASHGLAAHLVRDEGVAGSNPATPTST
jgi:hypothetical protein